MQQIFNIYKPIGLTPLEALEKFRKKAELPTELKMTYAGRLDPMAEGILLLLAGKKIYQKEKYLKLNKTYRAQILFGISTDTFDVLGKILKVDNTVPKLGDIRTELKKLKRKVTLPIPPYSSVPISGKPSFVHARVGKLSVENMHKREMEIFKITFHSYKKISGNKILKIIQKKIAKVSGDFRQEEILKLWEKKIATIASPDLSGRGNPFSKKRLLRRSAPRNDKFAILNLTISCASGTYIRSVAHTLGEKLSCPALLHSLVRTKIGKYNSNHSIKLK